MGVTRLKRKARRNKHTSAKRQNSIKQLNSQPVIKNIDKEAILASFGTAPAKEEAPAPVEVVEETPAAEVEAPVAEAPAVEEEAAEEVVAEAKEEAAEEEEEASTEEEAAAEEGEAEAGEEEKEEA